MLRQASPEVRQRFLQEFSKEILIQIAKTLPKETEIRGRDIKSIIEKLEEILHEEGVQAIECPAPDRYLIIKKNGKLKVLNMMLEEDEIETIMRYYFVKARKQFFNPFALTFPGFVITGLLSSRIGSRFVIKKSFLAK